MSEYQFEHREYLNDSAPEAIEALKSRVNVLEDNIILLREIPIVSPFSLEIVFDKMGLIASSYEKCAYVVDLSQTEIPKAESRRFINEHFKHMLSTVKYVAFVTGKNFVINTAVWFIMYQTNLEDFSISKTLDEAIIKTKTALND